MANDIIDERSLYPSYEIIGGEKIMAPAANLIHGGIIGQLFRFIGNYFETNAKGYVFSDNVDVYFPDGNLYRPDLSVVLKENDKILSWSNDIHGVPNMIVEVLSRSTFKKDLTVKKDTYAANGVGEYWIIDPWRRSVSVYLLRNDKYELDDEYLLYDADDFIYMTDSQKAEVKHDVPIHTLEGLKIPLEYIFKLGY